MSDFLYLALSGIGALLLAYKTYKVGLLHGFEYRSTQYPIILTAEEIDGSVLLHDYIDRTFVGQIKDMQESKEFISKKFPEHNVLVVNVQ